MAYKSKFLHFKTKASYNKERAKTSVGSEERKVFDAYISYIDEGPTICTWGKEYKCDISKAEVEKLIDNIEIGGRNLILKSNEDYSIIDSSKQLTLSCSYKSMIDKYVTISFDYDYNNVTTNGVKSRIGLEIPLRKLDGQFTYLVNCWLSLTPNSSNLSGNGRIYKIVKVPDNIEGNETYINVYIQVVSGNVRLYNFKMEQGNIPTAWTPAPEDKQDELISGKNIKTINGNSVLGSGNINTPKTVVENILTSTSSVNALSAAKGKELNDNKIDKTSITDVMGDSVDLVLSQEASSKFIRRVALFNYMSQTRTLAELADGSALEPYKIIKISANKNDTLQLPRININNLTEKFKAWCGEYVIFITNTGSDQITIAISSSNYVTICDKQSVIIINPKQVAEVNVIAERSLSGSTTWYLRHTVN